MPEFSVIVPVYNRPKEIGELLDSLRNQIFGDFEVIVVEDGSSISSQSAIDLHATTLNIQYCVKENSGQGYSRNYGTEFASGKWMVFFDSDCVIPSTYFEELSDLVAKENVQAFCGPDAADPSFSILQKAISYSMTSILTTGGIRGKRMTIDKTRHLRSYNMVVRSDVFRALGGFAKTNMGEDMEFSDRFLKGGFVCLISQNLMVYHKRRNTLKSFLQQVYSFGRTRIQLKRDYQIPVKLAHLFPFCFLCLAVSLPVVPFVFGPFISLLTYGGVSAYFLAIVLDSTFQNKSLKVGLVSLITSLLQLIGYGCGFASELIMGKNER